MYGRDMKEQEGRRNATQNNTERAGDGRWSHYAAMIIECSRTVL